MRSQESLAVFAAGEIANCPWREPFPETLPKAFEMLRFQASAWWKRFWTVGESEERRNFVRLRLMHAPNSVLPRAFELAADALAARKIDGQGDSAPRPGMHPTS